MAYYGVLNFGGIYYKPDPFPQNAAPSYAGDLNFLAGGQFGPTWSFTPTGGHGTGAISITATGVLTTWGGTNPFSITAGGAFATISNYVNLSPTSATFVLNLSSLGGTVTIADSNSATSHDYTALAIAPTAPLNPVLVDNHDGTITVTFDPPADSGGAPVNSYTATTSSGGFNNSGASSPIVISGINKGVSQHVNVTATNTAGTSSPSADSNSVTPITVPGAPTGLVATATTLGHATVALTPPVDNGGGAITGYTVRSVPPGGVDTNAGGTGTTHTMSGLHNAVAYTFIAVATNSYGTSVDSAPSNSITTKGFTIVPGGTSKAGVVHVTATGFGTAWTGSNPFSVTSGPGTISNYHNVDGTHATFDLTVSAANGTPIVIADTGTGGSGASLSFSTSSSVGSGLSLRLGLGL